MSRPDPDRLRALPPVDELLGLLEGDALPSRPRHLVCAAVRELLAEARASIRRGEATVDPAGLRDAAHLRRVVLARVDSRLSPRYRRVINATGIILHTGLGRAPLAEAAREALARVSGSCELEIDAGRKRRSRREGFVAELLSDLLGVEHALVVNNNAAAVLLSLSSLATGREVIVSRGELVEIGGGFRVPEVMERGGARLREVGTTNRTHLRDYEQAIGDETALILRVHPSNFRIVGFTAMPARESIVALAHRHDLPVVEDLGSGYLWRFEDVALCGEPTAAEAIAAGVDLVTFSGDKLLGGPQAGLVAGRRELIERLRADSLFRALRPDKLQLAALEATLLAYRQAGGARPDLPIWNQVGETLPSLEVRAEDLAGRLRVACPGLECVIEPSVAQIGSGSYPGREIPSRAVVLRDAGRGATDLDWLLRRASPPVFARVKDDRVWLDLRTVPADQLEELSEAIRGVLSGEPGRPPSA